MSADDMLLGETDGVDKPMPANVIPATSAAIYKALPPEARCQRETPHAPHNHEPAWRDYVASYRCDGNGGWAD